MHEEMAADACFDALSNDAFLGEFCSERMKTAEGADFVQKIADFFVELAKKLRQIIRDFAKTTDNAIVRELIEDEKMLSEINARFKKMLDSAKVVDNNADGVVKSEVRFSKNGPYSYSVANYALAQANRVVKHYDEYSKALDRTEWAKFFDHFQPLAKKWLLASGINYAKIGNKYIIYHYTYTEIHPVKILAVYQSVNVK